MSLIKKILGIIIIFVAIQLIPYGNSHVNPPVTGEPKWDSNETKALFDRACAACHSNETKYPWYSNIAPVSWLVQHDIDEGREKFNVSAWGAQKKNKGKDAADELQEDEMPPFIFTLTHPEARLTDEEKQQLIDGFKKTFGVEKDND
jgi:mono/diheme cytochrome c family protein